MQAASLPCIPSTQGPLRHDDGPLHAAPVAALRRPDGRAKGRSEARVCGRLASRVSRLPGRRGQVLGPPRRRPHHCTACRWRRTSGGGSLARAPRTTPCWPTPASRQSRSPCGPPQRATRAPRAGSSWPPSHCSDVLLAVLVSLRHRFPQPPPGRLHVAIKGQQEAKPVRAHATRRRGAQRTQPQSLPAPSASRGAAVLPRGFAPHQRGT